MYNSFSKISSKLISFFGQCEIFYFIFLFFVQSWTLPTDDSCSLLHSKIFEILFNIKIASCVCSTTGVRRWHYTRNSTSQRHRCSEWHKQRRYHQQDCRSSMSWYSYSWRLRFNHSLSRVQSISAPLKQPSFGYSTTRTESVHVCVPNTSDLVKGSPSTSASQSEIPRSLHDVRWSLSISTVADDLQCRH